MKIAVTLIILLLLGILIPKTFKDKVSDEYTENVKIESYTELDNPIQRILLVPGKIVVEEKTNVKGQYISKAYTLFGIRIAKLTITCNSTQIGDCGGTIEY